MTDLRLRSGRRRGGRRVPGRAVLAAVLAGVLAGTAAVGAPAASAQAHSVRSKPKLTDPHPCKDAAGFTCATLTVPLDHSGRVPGTLKLQVATSDNATAPKGVLLYLTGGPGLAGVSFAHHTWRNRLPGLAENYRLVMLDQRGTGEFGAIDCPALQQETVSSDIAPPRPEAVRECAKILGADRRFYRTSDTIADLELLRRALGVKQTTLNGVSYGAFVAARYAMAHPPRVRRLVLDAVWPAVDPQRDDTMALKPLRAHRRVLRAACAATPGCDWDPVADLAWLVRTRGDGVTLYDLIAVESFFQGPTIPAVLKAMHQARRGDPAELNTLIATLRGRPSGSHTGISFGLYTTTWCVDHRFPWGDSTTPLRTRQAALDARVKRLRPHEVYPYDRKTVAGLGYIQRCVPWPVTQPTPEPSKGARLTMPTLLINGELDLSTPAEWAAEMAARAPRGKLVIVKGEGHGIQDFESGHAGRDAVYAFLNQ